MPGHITGANINKLFFPMSLSPLRIDNGDFRLISLRLKFFMISL